MVPPHGLQNLKVAPYQFLSVRFTRLMLPVNPRCVPFEAKCVPIVSMTDTQIVWPLKAIITEGIPPILNSTAWATGVMYVILF